MMMIGCWFSRLAIKDVVEGDAEGNIVEPGTGRDER